MRTSLRKLAPWAIIEFPKTSSGLVNGTRQKQFSVAKIKSSTAHADLHWEMTNDCVLSGIKVEEKCGVHFEKSTAATSNVYWGPISSQSTLHSHAASRCVWSMWCQSMWGQGQGLMHYTAVSFCLVHPISLLMFYSLRCSFLYSHTSHCSHFICSSLLLNVWCSVLV